MLLEGRYAVGAWMRRNGAARGMALCRGGQESESGNMELRLEYPLKHCGNKPDGLC